MLAALGVVQLCTSTDHERRRAEYVNATVKLVQPLMCVSHAQTLNMHKVKKHQEDFVG